MTETKEWDFDFTFCQEPVGVDRVAQVNIAIAGRLRLVFRDIIATCQKAAGRQRPF